MEKRWINYPLPPVQEISDFGKELNINSYLTAILLQRGINDFASAKKFFRPSLEHLHDPFLMQDMEKAVVRLKQAIDKNEKILIYGDYDVDGTTAVAVVYSYLKSFYANCDFYIPDRYAEGYGVSEAGIIWAEQNGFTLIIALDLGIKASEMVSLAGNKGIDFIICDHHLPSAHIPQAVAVPDHKRGDFKHPFTERNGGGLGIKLVQASSPRLRR